MQQLVGFNATRVAMMHTAVAPPATGPSAISTVLMGANSEKLAFCPWTTSTPKVEAR